MRALVVRQYGPPSALSIASAEPLGPGRGQVRLMVQAAGINPYDWHQMTGTPFLVRNETGWRRPKSPRFGLDVAGVIEAVGEGVTQFAVGDAVFGRAHGAFADTVLASADELVRKPADVSFEAAAAVPIAALTALQGLRDQGAIAPGSKVLINGASGGVGTYAVQIARHFGADVTAVCSARNQELVTRLGAHQVVCYDAEDFSATSDAYDLVLDNIGNRSPACFKRCLKPSGVWVIVSGPKGRIAGPLAYVIRAFASFAFNTRRVRFFIAQHRQADLAFLAELLEAGALRTEIDRIYPLADAASAFEYLETGRARGKVILKP